MMKLFLVHLTSIFYSENIERLRFNDQTGLVEWTINTGTSAEELLFVVELKQFSPSSKALLFDLRIQTSRHFINLTNLTETRQLFCGMKTQIRVLVEGDKIGEARLDLTTHCKASGKGE